MGNDRKTTAQHEESNYCSAAIEDLFVLGTAAHEHQFAEDLQGQVSNPAV